MVCTLKKKKKKCNKWHHSLEEMWGLLGCCETVNTAVGFPEASRAATSHTMRIASGIPNPIFSSKNYRLFLSDYFFSILAPSGPPVETLCCSSSPRR